MTTNFRVTGKGKFPLDMLRYDACWPATQNDVIRMDANPPRGYRAVTLRSASRHTPTVDRWNSFGWKVER
jgi:hypothetical protein